MRDLAGYHLFDNKSFVVDGIVGLSGSSLSTNSARELTPSLPLFRAITTPFSSNNMKAGTPLTPKELHMSEVLLSARTCTGQFSFRSQL